MRASMGYFHSGASRDLCRPVCPAKHRLRRNVVLFECSRAQRPDIALFALPAGGIARCPGLGGHVGTIQRRFG